MSGNLRHVWVYFAEELWEPLADYSAKDADAPLDLLADIPRMLAPEP